jgi:hypothetical protein
LTVPHGSQSVSCRIRDTLWLEMSSDETTLSADLLAEWLEKKAPDVWWFLDGEREVSSRQALPAPGEDLAEAFRRHGGRLAVVREEPGALAAGEIMDIDSLARLFEADAEGRALELAWIANGKAGTPWLLLESVVNEDVKELPPEAWNG